jgi:iron complex outermembrane receptor protein
MRALPAALAAALMLPLSAAAQTLPEAPLIPRLEPHDRPGPLPIPAAGDLGIAPIFNLYRRDRITPDLGILRPMVEGTQGLRLGAGYGGAGDAREVFGQGLLRHGPYAAMGGLAWRDVGGYDDGAGDRTRYGYNRLTGNLGAVATPRDGTALRLVLLHDDVRDMLMPLGGPAVEFGVPLVSGAGADPLFTTRTALRLAGEHRVEDGPRIRLDAGYTRFDREADNFTLRASLPANRVRSQIAADIFDARLALDDVAGGVAWRIGLDLRFENRNGRRFGAPGLNSLAILSGRQAPDAETTEFGIFGEAAVAPWQGGRLALALRLDHAEAEAGAADDLLRTPGFTGAVRSLYAQYYGAGVPVSRSFTEPSALLRLDHQVAAGGPAAHGSLGRIARRPAIEELFFALPSAPVLTAQGTPARQVGNPTLSPEIHYRAEAGLAWQGEGWQGWMRPPPATAPGIDSSAWRFALTGHVSQVEDYIARDRARGQAGVLRSDFAAIWRNVDAMLAGVEADLQWNLTRNLATRANLAWTWGENRDTGKALYGIAPLEANLIAEWHDRLFDEGRWSIGAKLRLVAAQNRADVNPRTGSGYDVDQSDAFTLLDLFATVQWREGVALRVGLDNVTNAAFAEHLPFRTTDDTNFAPVRGPGRAVWARALITF